MSTSTLQPPVHWIPFTKYIDEFGVIWESTYRKIPNFRMYEKILWNDALEGSIWRGGKGLRIIK